MQTDYPILTPEPLLEVGLKLNRPISILCCYVCFLGATKVLSNCSRLNRPKTETIYDLEVYRQPWLTPLTSQEL